MRSGMKIPGSPYEKTIEEQRARTSALVALTGQDIPRVFHRQGNRIRDFRAAWDSACTAADLEGRIAHDFRRTAV